MIQAQRNKDTLVIAPVAMTNSQTASATYDLLGSDYATIRIPLSSAINTNAVGPTLAVSAADTSNSTAFVTMVATRTAESIVAAKEVVYHLDTKTAKRYMKLSISSGTTTNDNVTCAAIVTASRREQEPASTTDMVAVGAVVIG